MDVSKLPAGIDKVHGPVSFRVKDVAMDVRKLSAPSNSLLMFDKARDCDFYKIVLGPGEVRYLLCADIFNIHTTRVDVEQVIDEIRNSASGPVVKLELVLDWESEAKWIAPLDSLFVTAEWDERLRGHHAFFCSFYRCGVTSSVYFTFHRLLRLDRHFAIAECKEAWVKTTEEDDDLARSFLDSPAHIVIELDQRLEDDRGNYAVFEKTSFVQSRLDAILDEERQARVAEEAKHADEQAEQLRRSRFTTFVYVMEDTRNKRFKIGRSKTPGRREKTLQSEVPETVMRFSIPADESHEITLHQRFRHRRTRGEWFDLSAEELVETINYLKVEGDAERATVDFEWLGMLFFRTRCPVS